MNVTHILYEYMITLNDIHALIKMGRIERAQEILTQLSEEMMTDYITALAE